MVICFLETVYLLAYDSEFGMKLRKTDRLSIDAVDMMASLFDQSAERIYNTKYYIF